ncbi:MAG: YggS family pyridoxal phosphate-dependent enzyme [Acidobacteriota bacterium]|nr:YggS family pyridoxal phosphate-dependent enzyme [Acidobacteriota bacterium]
MPRDPKLKERLEDVQGRIDRVLNECMRAKSGLTLVAVTKRHPLSVVLHAYELGLRHFGENQIQEGIPKVKASPEDITWHMIGHLQKNKVRKAVKHFPYIHSIDSLSLLQRVDSIAGEERVCPKIFLQVNYALDADKYGLHPEAVRPVLEAAFSMKYLKCIGLMAIPPLHFKGEKLTAYFQGMVAMRDELKTTFPDWEGKLSLGMTGDFEEAVRAGSNYVRIGSALFGARE